MNNPKLNKLQQHGIGGSLFPLHISLKISRTKEMIKNVACQIKKRSTKKDKRVAYSSYYEQINLPDTDPYNRVKQGLSA